VLSDEELATMARDLESDRVERKESLRSGPPGERNKAKDRIGEAVCAFANDLPDSRLPGVVLIGVADDGTVKGITVTDELLRELADIKTSGNMLPFPDMSVARRTIEGKDVIAIEVRPSRDPPVRYYQDVWIRTGPRRGRATLADERVLREKRQADDVPFDRQGPRGASLADLDLDYFRDQYLPGAVDPEVLAANGRTIEEQLAGLRMLTRTGAPTHCALLALGKDPRAWLPGAYVQFLRIDGTTLESDLILDQKEVGGRLGDVLRRLDDLTALNIRVETQIGGRVVEARVPDYPALALQQLLRNAVMHRTYESYAPIRFYWFSDRVEIHSPGGLFGLVNSANFGMVTDYRNPSVAEALKTLGFVQRFGFGIASARQACAKNENPPPEFDLSSHAMLLATLRRRS
jgi:ATP-dependent DNA helicase RecG